jgi:hypothetical protein
MLAELPEPAGRPLATAAAALAGEARAMAEEVASAANPAEAAVRLPPRLIAHAGAVAALSDGISRRWFALLPVARSLVA